MSKFEDDDDGREFLEVLRASEGGGAGGPGGKVGEILNKAKLKAMSIGGGGSIGPEKINAIGEHIKRILAADFDKFLKDEYGIGPYTKPGDAEAVLVDFAKPVTLVAGDIVERTKCGMIKMQNPKLEKHEAAVVLEVWDEYVPDNDGRLCNGVIAYTTHEGLIEREAAELRFYKKVGS